MKKEARTKPKNARECLCGCGQHPKGDRFFCAGHDRFAETAIMKMFYGSVEALMAKHGFGTNGKTFEKSLVIGKLQMVQAHMTPPMQF